MQALNVNMNNVNTPTTSNYDPVEEVKKDEMYIVNGATPARRPCKT